MNPNFKGQESASQAPMSLPIPVESSGTPMGFQFDNARKRAIRLAKEQSDQSLDLQRGKEINVSQPMPVQPGLLQLPWLQPMPAPPLAPSPPPSILGGTRPPKEEGNDRHTRPSSWYGPSSTKNSESMDLLEERRKDREERRQERTEREQERVVRVHELQEREHEREERRKEREERELEREERRREREERVRSGGSTALDNASAKKILDLELKNDAMNSKVESLTNHLMSLKESTDVQFRKMKQALEAEQKKVNALVEYINLFQFVGEPSKSNLKEIFLLRISRMRRSLI